LEGIPLIHLGEISLPYATVCTLTMRGIEGDFERTVMFDAGRAKGWAFSVPEVGNYSVSIALASPPGNDQLHHNGNFEFSADELGDTFSAKADVFIFATSTRTPLFDQSRPFSHSDEMQPAAVRNQSSPIPLSRRLAPSAALSESAPFAATRRLSGSEFLNAPALPESSSSGIVAIVVAVVGVLAVIVVVLVVRSRTGKRSRKDVEDGLVSESGAGTCVTSTNPCADDGSDELEVGVE
jgi:hypothetical protein